MTRPGCSAAWARRAQRSTGTCWATSVDPQAPPVVDALELLQAIEGQALSQQLSLAKDTVDDLLSRATRLAEALCE